MRLPVLGSLLAGVALFATPALADVRVTIADGNVTVSAKDATIRQILAEWARVGQTRIVNLERVSGAPVSLELTNVPEAQALDVVLRSVSGYLAAPRSVELPNASRYDRIYLLPTSSGTPARAGAPVPAGPPAFAPASASPDDQADDDAARQVPVPGPSLQPPNGPRGPIFNTFPQPQAQPRQATPPITAPPAAPRSSAVPTVPVGVSTPGMVVPVPQQPGQAQPGNPDPR